MKLFGEYLIEKGILSKPDLVSALMDQMKSIPSVAEVAHQNRLLSNDDILDVLKVQFQKNSGFIDAAKELGLWNPNIQQEVEKKLQEVRVPLGEILVQKGISKMDVITHALDEFLSEAKADSIKVSIGAEILKVSESLENEVSTLQPEVVGASEKVNVAEMASQPSENHGSGIGVIYTEQFTPEMKSALLGCLTFTKPENLNKDFLKSAIDRIHSLEESARAGGLAQSELLIHGVETILMGIQNQGIEKVKADLARKIEDHGVLFVEMLFTIVEGLNEGRSEESVLETPDCKNTFRNLVSGADVIGFDIELMF